ncbi:MAG: hypothetical protein CMJ76_05325 [Planctomycetaceae bacterium]|nr:hypothetical protein [Planctomycetaceae bacterium]|tara:strand:+ start:9023 stop:9712 length:690 start_codon:yes stop_codon:yes gene_type:complete
MSVDELIQAKLNRIDQSHQVMPDKTALLVIDMQHGFVDEGASLEIPKARNILPNIQSLVTAFRNAAMPVIFTEFVYADTIPCLRGDPFGPEHLAAQTGAKTGFGHPSNNCKIGTEPGEGLESAATIDALKPLETELVVRGHTYDKFYGTHLDLALRSLGIDRFVITGVTTDCCVNSTIISGSTRNYRVTAISDAMATIHEHIHDACLQIWENKFARIRTTAELIAEITD